MSCPTCRLTGFSDECAALIVAAMPEARNLFAVGQSLGGLMALQIGASLPGSVKHVILLDPPFRLTRARPARVLHQVWRFTGENPYQARICQEIMGFDAATGEAGPTRDYHDAGARSSSTACCCGAATRRAACRASSRRRTSPRLRMHNPLLMIGAQLHQGGHALLADDPVGVRAQLDQFLVPARLAIQR